MTQRKSLGRHLILLLLFSLLFLLPLLSSPWVSAQALPTFVLVFIPLSWEGSMDEFRAAADAHAQAFIEASGLTQYATIEVQYADEILQAPLEADDLVSMVENFGLRHIPGDRYVGLTDGDIVHHGKESTVGWTYLNGTTAVCEAPYFYCTTHELGHTFGLCDEYAYEPWTRQNKFLDNGCPNPYPDHCRTDKENQVVCKGWPVENTWCIMGPAGVANKRLFGSYCRAHLESVFTQLFPPGPAPTVTPLPTSTPVTPSPFPSPTAPPTVGPSSTPLPTPEPIPSPTPASAPTGVVALALEQAGGYTIHLFDLTSGDLQRLEQTAGHAYASAWSPDGTQLAFVSDQGGTKGLFLLDLEQGSVELLLDDAADEENPAWSPDGEWLAFTSDVSGESNLYLLPKEGGMPIRLVDVPGDVIDLDWSPQGWTLAFSSNRDGDVNLYTLAIARDGDQFDTTLTQWTDWPGWEIMPAWSPDGQTIAFAANQSGVFQLYLMHLPDRQVEIVTMDDYHHRNPVWLPGGNWLLYRAGFDEQVELRFRHLPTGKEWVPSSPANRGHYPSAPR